eukprot:13731136-Heterocapsa_arctica.AAC.1
MEARCEWCQQAVSVGLSPERTATEEGHPQAQAAQRRHKTDVAQRTGTPLGPARAEVRHMATLTPLCTARRTPRAGAYTSDVISSSGSVRNR